MFKSYLKYIIITVIVGLIVGVGLWYSNYSQKIEIAKESQILQELASKHPGGQELLDQIKKMQEQLQTATAPDKKFEAYFVMGFSKDQLEYKEGAIKDYKKALEVDSKNSDVPTVLNNLANDYKYLKNYPEAEKYYLEIIEMDSSNIMTYRNLHEFYDLYYKEKADLADDILLKGLESNLDSPNLLSALAVYYEKQGDKDKAIIYFEKLLEVMPENEAAKLELEKLKQ